MMDVRIQEMARLLGYQYHSGKGTDGFPRFVIAGHGQLIFWELKAKLGGLMRAQADWIGTLSEVTGPPIVEVVRPEDLDRCLDLLHRRGR